MRLVKAKDRMCSGKGCSCDCPGGETPLSFCLRDILYDAVCLDAVLFAYRRFLRDSRREPP
jgi:hypothetical protein